MNIYSCTCKRIVGVAALGLSGLTPSAWAGETWSAKNFDVCPLEASIRTPDPVAFERFDSLAACQGQLVSAPVLPADARPDVVRILGVKVKPEDKPKADKRRTTAAATAFRYATPATPWDAAITRTAAAYRIDPLFLHAVIHTESRYRPAAVSGAGAVGLMQIMPATGLGLGVARDRLSDGATNIDAGARHLKKLQRRYGRNFDLILAAYNAGEGAVARYGNRIPAYRETQDYVGRVMGRYTGLRTGTVR